MKRKTLKVLVGTFILSLLLVGCGNTVTTADTNKENETSVNSQETEKEDSEIKTEEIANTEATEEQDNNTSSAELPTGHVADKLVVAYGDTTGTGLCTGLLGIARDSGYIEEELSKIGVTYEDMPMIGMGPAINEAFAAGSIDIGSMGDVIAVTGKSNGVNTKILSWSRGTNASSIVTAPGSDIKSISDLKGKKVQAYQGTFMYRDLIEYLKLGGLTIDDIEYVNCNATEAISMLLTGGIDASVNQGYPLFTAIEGGGELLIDGRDEEYSSLATNGLTLVRTEYVEENPDIIYAFTKALARAYKDVLDDSELYFRQYEEAGGKIEVENFSNPKHIIGATIVPTKEELDSEQALIDFMLETDLISENVDLEDWSDTSVFAVSAFEELGIKIPE